MSENMKQFCPAKSIQDFHRVVRLPKPHNLKAMSLEQTYDFVDLFKEETLLVLSRDAQEGLPVFWKQLAIELLSRIAENERKV